MSQNYTANFTGKEYYDKKVLQDLATPAFESVRASIASSQQMGKKKSPL